MSAPSDSITSPRSSSYPILSAGAVAQDSHLLRKICGLISRIFTLPSRYFEKLNFKATSCRLSTEEVKSYFPYIQCNYTTHAGSPQWLEGSSIKLINPCELNFQATEQLQNVICKEHCFIDPTTGLKLALYENGGEMIISFGTLNSGNAEFCAEDEKRAHFLNEQYKAIAANVLGGDPKVYEQGEALFLALKQQGVFQGKKVVLTGSCLAGSLAQYVSLKNNEKAVCFNPFFIGAGLQQKIGRERLEQSRSNVTCFIVETDCIADQGLFEGIIKVCSFFGIRAPNNFGERKTIPTGHCKSYNTHIHPQASMMAYMGYHAWISYSRYLEIERQIREMRLSLNQERVDNLEKVALLLELVCKAKGADHLPEYLKMKNPTPLFRLIEEIGLMRKGVNFDQAIQAHLTKFSENDRLIVKKMLNV